MNGTRVDYIYDNTIFKLLPGVYYIEISNTGTGPSYNIVLTNVDDLIAADSMPTAERIYIGEQIKAYRPTTTEIDYFKFVLDETQTITLVQSSWMTIEILDDAGTPVTGDLLEAGTYYVKALYTNNGEYTFTLNTTLEPTNAPTVLDNTMVAPEVLDISYFYLNHKTVTDGQIDYFGVTITETSKYKLTYTGQASTVEIYDNGVLINTVSNGEVFELAMGTYVFAITTAVKGEYEVLAVPLDAYDYSSDSSNPDAVSIYHDFEGYLGDGETDYFILSLTGNGAIAVFNFNSKVEVTLYTDPNFTVGPTTITDNISIALLTGTYYVKVTHTSTELEAYQLEISND